MNFDTPVWLEVALNGAVGRKYQPNMPVTPEEIIEDAIACHHEGAAIIHLHTYNKEGIAVEDVDIYSRIIEAIRARCDCLPYISVGW